MSDNIEQVIPEDNQPEQNPQVDHQNEAEARARAQGWVPKEEWAGEGKWRDAESFLDRGELFSKIDQVRRENRDLRKTQEAFAQHMETVRKAEFNKALESLKSQKRQALIDGDPDLAVDLDEKLVELKLSKKELESLPQQQQNQPHPEFVAWADRNNWYITTPHMRIFADQVGAEMTSNGITDPATVLKEVEARVRKEFPSRFTNPNRAKPGAVEGSSAKGGSTPSKETFQLSPVQRQVMERLVRSGAITKEQYIADLKAKGD